MHSHSKVVLHSVFASEIEMKDDRKGLTKFNSPDLMPFS